jgi:putative membrane protein
MTTYQFFTRAWQWNPALLLICAGAIFGYLAVFGRRGRARYFAAAVLVFLLALLSPLGALANRYLFSAHMTQHILLVLIVPAFLLLSLPRTFSLPRRLQVFAHPLVGWTAGVGAMWLWHAPALCNAANTSRIVFAVETITLIIMGGLFWWQVIAPREADRLSPLLGMGYLFTACVACSILGIIITFAPVSVCPVFQHPVDQFGMLSTIRGDWGLTSDRDQQIGGLLMWVPMCLIYVTAILAQLARWHSGPAPQTEESNA